MCGIFGAIAGSRSQLTPGRLRQSLELLARLSISRGKDSSGIAFSHSGRIDVVKGDLPVTTLIKTAEYKVHASEAMAVFGRGETVYAMGHARLVTNGSQLHHENNQPVVKNGLVAIHNGIIVNDAEIWQKHPQLKREFAIDTEALLALANQHIENCVDPADALVKAGGAVKGTASVALMPGPSKPIVLFTNNGSLYYLWLKQTCFFASEKAYLEKFRKSMGETSAQIMQVPLNKPLVLTDEATPADVVSQAEIQKTGIRLTTVEGGGRGEVVIDPSVFSARKTTEDRLFYLLENNSVAIGKLTRCSKCILPSTFPFISFDNTGVCNYCENYTPKLAIKGAVALETELAKFRRRNGGPDCMVPFSGGRDSCYTLHLLKKELGMHPIAFTYEWGMVTDLARRNAARVCGKLGVENIIVAADIRRKRENIRKNLEAWLKKPHLGLVPLLMAGDKYFFYHCNRLMRLNAIDVSVWGINPLENTDFKSGFTGIRPHFAKSRIDQLKLLDKLKLAAFFGKQFIANPAFLNSSLVDSMGAFASRYLMRRKGHISLFDHLTWEEQTVESVLFGEYDWEVAIDSPGTWRIGDGTAAFYNYVYHTVAGFSEFDTFRSNQIREGQITREKAMNLVAAENVPRYESLRWYLEIVGVDFERAVNVVNNIPKLYHPPGY